MYTIHRLLLLFATAVAAAFARYTAVNFTLLCFCAFYAAIAYTFIYIYIFDITWWFVDAI